MRPGGAPRAKGAEGPFPFRKALQGRLRGRVVVVGIGNPFRGDDVAGSLVARNLRARLSWSGAENGSVVEAEDVPEAFLGPLTRPVPQVVVLVDAVELGEAPGTVALLEVEELQDRQNTTHAPSLSLLARYIRTETGADVFVLGIQPGTLDWDERPSAPVVDSAGGLARLLASLLAPASSLVEGGVSW